MLAKIASRTYELFRENAPNRFRILFPFPEQVEQRKGPEYDYQ
jgi:hypothetical protein